MAGLWTSRFSFVAGAVRSNSMTYLALVGDEAAAANIQSTHFALWRQGDWYDSHEGDWNVAGLTVAVKPLEQMIALGESGDVICVGSGDHHTEHVAPGENGPEDRGPMRGVKRIGSRVYAVGMCRQTYRRDDANVWTDITPPAPATDKPNDVNGFEAVDGFDESDIYAVGWEGEIWRYDGSQWARLPSVTNNILTAVCCAGDGKVYAAGRQGLLLRGRDQHWEVVDTDGLREDIWSLAWFEGQLYFSTFYGLYTLAPGGIDAVDMGAEEAETFHRLSTGDGVLWSVGAKDVMAFDGKTWTRID